MDILVLCANHPQFPGSGSQTRLFCLLRELAGANRIHLLVLSPDTTGWDRQSCVNAFATVQVIPPSPVKGNRLPALARRAQSALITLFGPPNWVRLTRRYRDGVSKALQELEPSRFDLVFVELALMLPAQTGFLPGIPRIVDLYDLLYHQQQRSAHLVAPPKARWKAHWEALKTWFWERHFLSQVQWGVPASEVDRDRLKSLVPGLSTSLVPNGVDSEYFCCDATPGQGKILLFTGKMDYFPNHDAALYMAQFILPKIRERHPDAEFHVVGMSPLPALIDAASIYGITVHGEVPDTRPYLEAATVVVVPLRAGSGTRLKILEAFACRKAVVSTRIGAEGLDVTEGQHLLLADEPQDFAAAACELLENGKRRQHLGKKGRALVEAQYDWKIIAVQLKNALRAAMGEASVASRGGAGCR